MQAGVALVAVAEISAGGGKSVQRAALRLPLHAGERAQPAAVLLGRGGIKVAAAQACADALIVFFGIRDKKGAKNC